MGKITINVLQNQVLTFVLKKFLCVILILMIRYTIFCATKWQLEKGRNEGGRDLQSNHLLFGYFRTVLYGIFDIPI
jgi:hypothetical protein